MDRTFNYIIFDESVNSKGEKVAKLKQLGIIISSRTNGLFDGEKFVNDFAFKDIIGVLCHCENDLQTMCKRYAETSESLNATTSIIGINLINNEDMKKFMSNLCKKFVNMEIQRMQQCELIFLNNSFQASYETEFSTDNNLLMMVFDFLTALLYVKEMIHGNNVAPPNIRGYDRKELNLIISGEDFEFDDDIF